MNEKWTWIGGELRRVTIAYHAPSPESEKELFLLIGDHWLPTRNQPPLPPAPWSSPLFSTEAEALRWMIEENNRQMGAGLLRVGDLGDENTILRARLAKIEGGEDARK